MFNSLFTGSIFLVSKLFRNRKDIFKSHATAKASFLFVFFEAGGGEERGLTRAIQLLPGYCKKIMYLMKRTERKILFNNQNPLIFTCATLLRNQTKFETSKLISSVVFNKPSSIGLINFCLQLL